MATQAKAGQERRTATPAEGGGGRRPKPTAAAVPNATVAANANANAKANAKVKAKVMAKVKANAAGRPEAAEPGSRTPAAGCRN